MPHSKKFSNNLSYFYLFLFRLWLWHWRRVQVRGLQVFRLPKEIIEEGDLQKTIIGNYNVFLKNGKINQQEHECLKQ